MDGEIDFDGRSAFNPPVGLAARALAAALQARIVGEVGEELSLDDHYPPPDIAPTWLSATVVDLVRAILADQTFDRLPILADALEDAGCTNNEIVNHCRSKEPHVLSCWVLDAIQKALPATSKRKARSTPSNKKKAKKEYKAKQRPKRK